MRSDDLSRDIIIPRPSGDKDVGERLGTILTWDDLTGQNTVDIEGQIHPNLRAVQTGIGISYNPGDVVVISRKQSTFYIRGKVAAANGSAGSAIQEVRFGYSDTVNNTSGSWVNVPSGTVAVDAYIGSSRRALVMWRADVSCNNSFGEVSWKVSGASTIAVASRAGMSIVHDADSGAAAQSTAVKATLAGFFTMRATDGLNQGLNTFTMQYRVGVHGTGVSAVFGSPQMTVIPL